MKMKLEKKGKIALSILVLLIIGFVVGSITLTMITEKTYPIGDIKFDKAISVERIVTKTLTTTTVTAMPAIIKAGGEAAIPTYYEISSSGIQVSRMEIFTASMTIEVEDVKAAANDAMNLAKQLNGYVSGSSITTYKGKEIATVTIRVPRDKFYIAINMLSQFGNMTNLNTRSQDVTEEYIDLKARRDNLLKQEERLKEILKMAKNVDEVLKIEKELARVRGEIESLTGKINFIEKRVELSTITIRFIPKTVKKPGQPGLDWFKPIEIGIQALYTVIFGLIVIAFGGAPIAAVAIPTYYVYKQRRKKSKKQ